MRNRLLPLLGLLTLLILLGGTAVLPDRSASLAQSACVEPGLPSTGTETLSVIVTADNARHTGRRS